jgi:L-arabinonolactonase
MTTLSIKPGQHLRWDAQGARWWWSGASAVLHAYSVSEQQVQTGRLPDQGGLLAHTRSGRLLLGLPKRLCTALPGPSARPLRLQPVVAVDPAEPRTSIADGCTDRIGALVFGTANAAADRRPIGSFYHYSRQHGLRRLALPAVAQASGICFSMDGSRLYFADAAKARILQCRYDAATASVSEVSLFAELAPGFGPRGAAIDAEDCLWSAQAGRLVRYAPDGSMLQSLDIDCSSPAFGGSGLAQFSAAGSQGLVALPAPPAPGFPSALFDDQE